jgi:protocatechuate 3,4-dioxygenase beta subunit
MDEHPPHDETRRRLLGAMVAAPFLLSGSQLLRLGFGARVQEGTALTPTPQCGDDDDDPTPAQTEGPFFTPRSPERRSLLATGLNGTRLTVTGLVVTRSCRPVAGALVDFWQADDGGEYDNKGYRLRGHQFTDAQGRYRLDTIVPGLYPGRTRHIHVKVQAPSKPILTTQLYFPHEPQNASDGIFDPSLLLRGWRKTGARRVGTFDFVLDV